MEVTPPASGTVPETISEKSCDPKCTKDTQSKLKTGVASVNQSRTLGISSAPEGTDDC